MSEETNTKPAQDEKEPNAEPTVEKRPKLSDDSTTEQSLDKSLNTGEPMNMAASNRVQHQMVAASPPRFINLEEIMKMANGLTDLKMAHELAVNSDFRIEKTEPPPDSLEGRVKHVVHKAFWDMLQTKLFSDPDDHTYAIKLIQEVKNNLLEVLLPQHTRVRAGIEEVIDMKLIEQRAERGELDFRYYADYVVNIMKALCAPVRDEQIAAIQNITEIVPLYKEICDVLELMKLDMANYTIAQLRPIIKKHSAEYERAQFQSLLDTQRENGRDGLEFTRDWLSRHFQQLTAARLRALSSLDVPVDVSGPVSSSEQAGASTSVASAQSSDALAGATASVSPRGPSLWSAGPKPVDGVVATQAVVNSAYVELLDWDPSRLSPETLLLDAERIVALCDRVKRVTLVACVQVVTYSTVGAAIQGISEFKLRLTDHVQILVRDVRVGDDLKETMTGVAELVAQISAQCLVDHGFKSLSAERADTLKSQIVALSSPSNPVRQLMKSRFTDFVQKILTSPSAQKNARIPPGFSAVEKELTGICEDFVRIIAYNYAVFGGYYRDIVDVLKAAHAGAQ